MGDKHMHIEMQASNGFAEVHIFNFYQNLQIPHSLLAATRGVKQQIQARGIGRAVGVFRGLGSFARMCVHKAAIHLGMAHSSFTVTSNGETARVLCVWMPEMATSGASTPALACHRAAAILAALEQSNTPNDIHFIEVPESTYQHW